MTEQLKAVRLGKITASQVYKLMGKDPNAFTQTAISYLWEVVAERTTGEAAEDFSTAATRWGNTYEPIAFAKVIEAMKLATSLYFGEQPQFFALMTAEGWAGASPDALIDGVPCEIKCPYKSANHCQNWKIIDAESFKKIREEYYWQLTMQMICTEQTFGYFVSYDPRNIIKPLHIVRIELNEADAESLKAKVSLAVQWVKNEILSINKNQTV